MPGVEDILPNLTEHVLAYTYTKNEGESEIWV